jgi:hypothetical protein
MENCRSDGPETRQRGAIDIARETAAPEETSITESIDRPAGDVIHGLRNGLLFSLAIWAALFMVGALVFG